MMSEWQEVRQTDTELSKMLSETKELFLSSFIVTEFCKFSMFFLYLCVFTLVISWKDIV